MNSISKYQYNLVCDAREALLAYCASLSSEELVQEIPDFGRSSIRNLLIHNANTYQFWIGQFALKQTIRFAEATNFSDIEAIRQLYISINDLVVPFLRQLEGQLKIPIIGKNFSGAKTLEMTPLQLFTHVITHEFHHKGQILSMSRNLGYTPPDTGIIR